MFKRLDVNGDGMLSMREFTDGMKELFGGGGGGACELKTFEIRALFQFFDTDCTGSISKEEFITGVRGQLNARRLQMVDDAFKVIDKDGSGVLDLDDIIGRYSAKGHPDVVSGRRAEEDVLREFLDTFDGGEKDGNVTPDEFRAYYSNVSACIDNDDYFELMMRNAWHMSGGEGWAANTTCKRVLVTHRDGGGEGPFTPAGTVI